MFGKSNKKAESGARAYTAFFLDYISAGGEIGVVYNYPTLPYLHEKSQFEIAKSNQSFKPYYAMDSRRVIVPSGIDIKLPTRLTHDNFYFMGEQPKALTVNNNGEPVAAPVPLFSDTIERIQQDPELAQRMAANFPESFVAEHLSTLGRDDGIYQKTVKKCHKQKYTLQELGRLGEPETFHLPEQSNFNQPHDWIKSRKSYIDLVVEEAAIERLLLVSFRDLSFKEKQEIVREYSDRERKEAVEAFKARANIDSRYDVEKSAYGQLDQRIEEITASLKSLEQESPLRRLNERLAEIAKARENSILEV